MVRMTLSDQTATVGSSHTDNFSNAFLHCSAEADCNGPTLSFTSYDGAERTQYTTLIPLGDVDSVEFGQTGGEIAEIEILFKNEADHNGVKFTMLLLQIASADRAAFSRFLCQHVEPFLQELRDDPDYIPSDFERRVDEQEEIDRATDAGAFDPDDAFSDWNESGRSSSSSSGGDDRKKASKRQKKHHPEAPSESAAAAAKVGKPHNFIQSGECCGIGGDLESCLTEKGHGKSNQPIIEVSFHSQCGMTFTTLCNPFGSKVLDGMHAHGGVRTIASLQAMLKVMGMSKALRFNHRNEPNVAWTKRMADAIDLEMIRRSVPSTQDTLVAVDCFIQNVATKWTGGKCELINVVF